MKRIIFLLFLTVVLIPVSFACTTFFINKNGQLIFGRNYDWVTGNGMVCTNGKGLSKTSDPTKDGGTIHWVSQYGSITFNQYGKEFPTGGMNEKGLVVELMWLDGTRYATADNRPAIGELQWIQYQLDNCATVDELIATDNVLRIASIGQSPLHFLVADASGNAATIEFLDGKMQVHKGKDLPFPVLTNNRYDESLQQTATAVKQAGNLSFTDNSIDRFAKACSMVNLFQQTNISTPVVDYSFSILDKVAQGDHTKWSIVYDISNKKVYFKTRDYPGIKNLSFPAFDFNCKSTPKAWNMNQLADGNISSLFVDFSLEMNSKIVNQSFDESSSQFTVSEEGRKSVWQYPASISCFKQAN